jgi:Mn-dependent DtxR family transcriptional regulator
MSVKRTSACWDNETTSGNDRLAMLALADHADDNGFCWPSIKTISEKIRCSERTTIRIIQRLEELGVVYIEHSIGRGHSNRYIVTPGLTTEQIAATLVSRLGKTKEEASAIAHKINTVTVTGFKKPIKGDSSAQKVTVATIKGDTAMSPEPSVEPSVKPSNDRNDRPPADAIGDGTVMDALRRVNEKLDTPMSKRQLNQYAELLMEQDRTYLDVYRLWADCKHADKPIAAFVKAIKENDGLPYGFTPKQTSKGSAAANMYERYFLPGTGWIEPARPDRTG